MSSHGLTLIVLLRENMKQLGRKPSDVENAAVIDQYLEANAIKMKRVRKKAEVKPRARDAIFDLLAKCDGQTGTLTRHAGSRIAAAKKQILEVMPGADTATVVAEIEKRWARFCRKFTEKRMQTAMALVGHWGEFGDADATDRRRTRAEAMNIYIEPAGDWRAVFCRLFGVTPDVAQEKLWPDLAPDYRTAILAELLKIGA